MKPKQKKSGENPKYSKTAKTKLAKSTKQGKREKMTTETLESPSARKRPKRPRRPVITGETLAERIRSARQSLGLAQAPLAGRAGLTQGHICDIERGRKQPSVAALRAIAAALETTVGRLLGED